MSINKSQFITVAEMAKMLGVTRAAINKQISEKKIPAEKVGRNYLIPKTALPAGLEERIRTEQKKATDMVIKKSHHHDLDFEKELWAAADKLRGNIDVSEYKNIVLGLLFLKYISDAFYKRHEELEGFTRDPKNEDFYVKDEKARAQILETKDFYKSVGVFYVPEKSRWEYLQTKTMQSDIGQVLDKAMDLIEEDNRAELEGVLPKIYTRTTLDHAVIGELVNIFSRISFDHDFDREKDILGRIYEYFLGQFASSEGKRGGEFFTPRSIVKLLVEVLEPYENARVLDPACGSGGMFVSMGEYLRNHGQDPSKLAISGQESNQTTLRLAKMNLAIRGLSGKVELGNTYYEDKFPHLQADFVIANPPFNAEWDPSRLSDSDPRITLGIPQSSNANFMWVQHFTHHLAPNGYAGFVMPNGATAVAGKEGELRQKLIETDIVDIIISCPPKLFYNVPLPVSLWFLAKNKSGDRFRKRSGETLFIDARSIFEQISRKQVVLNPDHISKIANTVRAWRGESDANKYEDVPGFCKSVNIEQIRNNKYYLNPGLYVGLAEAENEKISFDESLAITSSFLKKQTKINQSLNKEISFKLNKFYPQHDWSNLDFSSREILEDLCKRIFAEWFVKFNYPTNSDIKFVDSEVGRIPEGWSTGALTDSVDVLGGGTPKTDVKEYWNGNVPFFTPGDANGSFYSLKTEKYITQKGLENCNSALYPKNTVFITARGTVGKLALAGVPMAMNQSCYALKGKDGISNFYVYLLVQRLIESLQKIAVGGVFDAITTATLKNIQVVKPPASLIDKFDELVQPIFEFILATQQEYDTLIEARKSSEKQT
ncbi:MAG TPA: N-6 DNA methylase [Candidatus Paceibacterota bacterium]|nr:N-6 DNA methylase [Candidatus Paceibacterota bacterium]